MTVVRAGRLVLPDSVIGPAWLRVEGDRIADLGAGEPATCDVDLGDATLVPGFVDLHCHGGGGHSFSDGPEAALGAVAAHRRSGTTTSLASLVTDTLGTLEHQVRDLAPLVADDELAGVHLEGPWLSSIHCGAHDPALLRDPDPDEVDGLVSAVPGAVRMVTVAVERQGGLDAVRRLADRGVIAALGHSDATYALAHAAVDAGVRVATHLYNAARAVHHREPGLVLALLEREEVTVELIADGIHLHPAVLRDAAVRASGRFALVSDAMAAAGAADGSYRLGGLQVAVVDGVARLVPGGAIAGSAITLAQALHHAVHVAGVDLPAAVAAITSTPARVLGRDDVGRLAPGAYADLVVLDASTRVRRVMRRGAWLDEEIDD
ncbi:N-acetylglucosamine-6-phosphate deacetylase [Nocardioides currus]|uniref:N-acetylglucosamine-6-phosphate deacetylase n=1 Tax=Nocardioides currus TaxID=2133958 RepID=A0A2R7YVM7_9ACTN|nr:N-acetylglucosamine-6-phosphate deacetylase [Nocardioides currus]PUA80381.1 N-acetylglucosamine-6-phosphate deacetylase [Nocardioides currus]